MFIILYSTDCPRCKVLETKLNEKHISYNTVKNVAEMESKGFREAPVLEVDGNTMKFPEALKWVNER